MNYEINLDTADFEIRIDPGANYGYWEFKGLNNVGGKMYFGAAAPAAGEVLHGDGIPMTVATALNRAEYLVADAFIVADPALPPEERRRG